MHMSKVALVASATAVTAQRPEDTPICDYYTTALLEENTAENQATLLTLLVNTVVIGNYTMPNVGVSVPGILAPGEVDGVEVELMPYFDGTLATTNTGGDEGEQVNFLDGGGAAPLMENMPAEDEQSNQYFLLTHLYTFFGALLGCSEQGMPGFDAYTSAPSMYRVHKFMNLNFAENSYFIQQVGLAAASFGVAEEDIAAVAEALNTLFNVRCAPPTTVIPDDGDQLHSICIDEETCPLAENADCDAYAMEDEETPDDGCTMMMPEPSGTMEPECTAPPSNGTTSGMPTPTGSMPEPTGTDGMPTPVPTTGGAAMHGLGLAGIAVGVAAYLL